MACLSHIGYHSVRLWNEIAADWLRVVMWFGTYSCLGVRMCTVVYYVHYLWLKPRDLGCLILVM